MKLAVVNGSPRGRRSNTQYFLKRLIEGVETDGESTADVIFLARSGGIEQAVAAFENNDAVLLGFPLYTDCMPGVVMELIDRLKPLCNRAGNPPMLFFVQSGFPEAVHSRGIEMYLEKLCTRLKSPYIGTIIKPSGEGVQDRPEKWSTKNFDRFRRIGRHLAETGTLDTDTAARLARPEKLGFMLRMVMSTLMAPFVEAFWNKQLKANNAFEERYARPFQGGGGEKRGA